jgi:hypothetical protein
MGEAKSIQEAVFHPQIIEFFLRAHTLNQFKRQLSEAGFTKLPDGFGVGAFLLFKEILNEMIEQRKNS